MVSRGDRRDGSAQARDRHMFDTILIANRGEIACRIARSCRALGLRSVAVYSEADRGALHVEHCDEAWLIGPAPARESYLNAARILEVARASGAQAIHPGYGFLSENAGFARACEAAGVVFIGPPASAIEAMGSKSAAKAIMDAAGVPLVPGYHGEDQSLAVLAEAAERIGYPVLIKASAGGGGKGMRRVDHAEAFADALASARREAASAFGDDQVLVEKYLIAPRHIEVQVFADHHGNTVHLFERDCSVQRRHQKVIEEAPAPGLDPVRRAEIGAAAVAAARAIGYVGAGTVEFIMDADGRFYFMEMNTRLQVEHPVTELITGQDLVAWQLAVAAGGPLPLGQAELAINGHALEARIYAEDPERDFLPAVGTVSALHTPAESAQVRVDIGIRAGDTIPVHYDPMIAKLIVWDHDRDAALRRLRAALAEFLVIGTTTNTAFLSRIAAHPAFAAGGVDTGFIDTHRASLLAPPAPVTDRELAAAALFQLLRQREAAADAAGRSDEPDSPWHHVDGWHMNSDNPRPMYLQEGEQVHTVVARARDDGFVLGLPGGDQAASGQLTPDGRLRLRLGGMETEARVLRDGSRLTIALEQTVRTLAIHDPLRAEFAADSERNSLTAPMPGLIRAVHVAPGDRVEAGAALVVLEAMKMEYTIRAAADGVVARVNVAVGDQVSEGSELLGMADGENTEGG
jgi:3-methylcrotonyl-CoA carboxylase alpha subunit